MSIYPHHRLRRRYALITAVLVVALVGGGVWWRQHSARWQADHAPDRTEAQPGDPPIPAIDWPRGQPHDGRWQDNPWVQAIRHYSIVSTAAYNTGDPAASTDLADLINPEYIRGEQRQAVLTREVFLDPDPANRGYQDGIPIFPGPLTFSVTDVTETDTDATVITCRTSARFQGPQSRTLAAMSSTSGTVVYWDLESGPEGQPFITHIREQSTRCEDPDPHYGLFDPAPDRFPTDPPTGDPDAPHDR